jgi:hypothetical protein
MVPTPHNPLHRHPAVCLPVTLAILLAKYDYSDVYRQIAHSASVRAQTISTYGAFAYIYNHLTFGGSPNPPTWCNFSEIVTDLLANEISQCDDWDPETLRNPDQPETPIPIREPEEIPLGEAKELAVMIPTQTTIRVNGFINYRIDFFLDTERNCAQEPHTVPLAMFVTSRPHAGEEEPITRRAILSMAKLFAEGSSAERQVVLGWMIDTQRLLLALPDDKYKAWTTTIRAILKNGHCTREELGNHVQPKWSVVIGANTGLIYPDVAKVVTLAGKKEEEQKHPALTCINMVYQPIPNSQMFITTNLSNDQSHQVSTLMTVAHQQVTSKAFLHFQASLSLDWHTPSPIDHL